MITYVTAQPSLESFLLPFKHGTVTQLLEHWRTTAGLAPAGLQGSEVVLNTLGPLQSRRFPPHFKTKVWQVRGCLSGTCTDKGTAKVPHECLWGILARAASGAGTEGSAETAQPHISALLRQRARSLQHVAVLHRGQNCTMLCYKL